MFCRLQIKWYLQLLCKCSSNNSELTTWLAGCSNMNVDSLPSCQQHFITLSVQLALNLCISVSQNPYWHHRTEWGSKKDKKRTRRHQGHQKLEESVFYTTGHRPIKIWAVHSSACCKVQGMYIVTASVIRSGVVASRVVGRLAEWRDC